MCGIIAIYSQKNSTQTIYQGLLELQHRGQDAAGIASLLADGLELKRGLGRVEEVFSAHSFAPSDTVLAIGHTRYITSGGSAAEDSQPFYSAKGVALAHSGHLHHDSWMNSFNDTEQSLVDSNLLLQFLVQLLEQDNTDKDDLFFPQLCKAVTTIFQQVKGSYSVVSLIAGKGLVVFRDPQGIRPLVLGERLNPCGQKDYLFASESHFFQNLGFQQQEEVQAGELVFINPQGQLYRQTLVKKTPTPCSFEYVYFAHPQTKLNGVLVEDSRKQMGRLLAQQWQDAYSHLSPDFVLPIPQTATTAALAFAQTLGFSYCDYFKVNNSVGRTFIQPESQQRLSSVNEKLSINPEKIKDKIILLFDDSIVRGTTAQQLVKKLRGLGAKTIYLVSACPPIINVCTYGINIPTKQELLASKHSKEEIKAVLAVDELLYPNREDLLAVITTNQQRTSSLPCMRCMSSSQ